MLRDLRLGGLLFPCLFVALAGCAEYDAAIVRTARTSLIGMAQTDLETCLGLPDQKVTSGKTTIFTYFAAPTRTVNLSVPIVNTVGVSFSEYCHATFRLDNGRVTQIHYTGDTDALGSKDSACAPIVRSCVESLWREKNG